MQVSSTPFGIVVVTAHIMFQAIPRPVGTRICMIWLASHPAESETIIGIAIGIKAPAFTHLHHDLHAGSKVPQASWCSTEELHQDLLPRDQTASADLAFGGIPSVQHAEICSCGFSTGHKAAAVQFCVISGVQGLE